MDIRIVDMTTENIKECEQIRHDSVGYLIEEQYLLKTFYAKKMLNEEVITFGAYLNDQLAAGCYVSSKDNLIFIEQLFVQKKYQETGLYLGRNLLSYILKHKEIVEEYFGFQTDKSAIIYSDDKPKKIYEKLGYKQVKGDMFKMEKNL